MHTAFSRLPHARPLRSLLSAACLAVGIGGSPRPAGAQVFYTTLDAAGNHHLAEINGDGTGNTAINLPFTNLVSPTWTDDGLTMAVTALDPNAGSQHSSNVFAFDPETGGLTQITHYTDIFDPGTNTASYTFPVYKAFSHDKTALATFSIVQAGRGDGSAESGFTSLPVLEIHSLTTAANPVQVLVDGQQNGSHHGGEGVDWSPTQNVLAAPLEAQTPYASTSGDGDTTAIYLIAPVTAAKQTGQIQQITFPQADASINTGVVETEHDYLPKFSPNGTGLAYVRSFQSQNLSSSLVPNPDIQSLHILNLNTGADTQIVQFPQGRYITQLDWSPDGSALVFDLGLQPNSQVGPLQQADPTTDQVYIIGTDGSGLRQLLGNGTGYPSWRPLVSAAAHPAFFTGEAALSNGVFFLRFATGNPFGYYSYLTDPRYIFHFDLGYEYVFDANDGKAGMYFYDFASSTFFYTSPTFPFPYLYDFTLNTVLYYYPDPNQADHYNTDGVRYFYRFDTGKIINK